MWPRYVCEGGAMDRKIKRVSLVDQVYSEVLGQITSGELGPGARLNIEDISKLLGVSRTPVREAISRLIQDGYVEQKYNAGPSVISFSIEKELDLSDANDYITEVVMKSLKELDDIGPLISELGEVIEAQRLAFAEEDFEEFHRQSSLFHETLIRWCPNETIRDFADHIYRQLNLSTLRFQQIEANRQTGLVQHSAVYEALKADDIELALKLMNEHDLDGTMKIRERISEKENNK